MLLEHRPILVPILLKPLLQYFIKITLFTFAFRETYWSLKIVQSLAFLSQLSLFFFLILKRELGSHFSLTNLQYLKKPESKLSKLNVLTIFRIFS